MDGHYEGDVVGDWQLCSDGQQFWWQSLTSGEAVWEIPENDDQRALNTALAAEIQSSDEGNGLVFAGARDLITMASGALLCFRWSVEPR